MFKTFNLMTNEYFKSSCKQNSESQGTSWIWTHSRQNGRNSRTTEKHTVLRTNGVGFMHINNI